MSSAIVLFCLAFPAAVWASRTTSITSINCSPTPLDPLPVAFNVTGLAGDATSIFDESNHLPSEVDSPATISVSSHEIQARRPHPHYNAAVRAYDGPMPLMNRLGRLMVYYGPRMGLEEALKDPLPCDDGKDWAPESNGGFTCSVTGLAVATGTTQVSVWHDLPQSVLESDGPEPAATLGVMEA